MVNHEEDPFATFEQSLTNHKMHHHGQVAKHHSNVNKRGRVSHAQKKKLHRSHANADSVPACTSLGCAKDSAAKAPPDPWPKDYPVANWGADHDMATTSKNMADAEGKLGAWNPKQNEDGVYEVPHVDAEFKLNRKSHKSSQGKEELAGVQADVRLGAKSDPVCSSAGCTQYQHPSKELGYKLDYFVPNFGKDHDVHTSEQSASQAEAAIGHTFTPTQDEDGEWEVPTETAEFKLAGVKADLRLGHKKNHGSDPSCTSAGWCGESLWPAKKAKKEHSVLRHDTDVGANRAPTEEKL